MIHNTLQKATCCSLKTKLLQGLNKPAVPTSIVILVNLKHLFAFYAFTVVFGDQEGAEIINSPFIQHPESPTYRVKENLVRYSEKGGSTN